MRIPPKLLSACLLAGSALPVVAQPTTAPRIPQFDAPVRLKAAGEPIRVEEPGYAAPCLVDVDGDGRKDLVVGQFAGGKMKVFRRNADGSFAEGTWLRAGGKIAEVPGVW